MTIENSVGELVPTLAQPFWVYLARLNRKERYWLLRDALGEGSARLSSNFTAKFDPKWRPSPDAWWGMDYHFDWMVAALWAAGRDAGSLSDTHKPAFAKRISGN
ncbi:hypothetical protein IHQ68_17845 [Chelatococcus sambhunathii]|uniref:Uncharacterized protein n=1 Tax=Chelatococcus sambhunathii TaxID=363953 RepID=A0ABU1DK30_9HYPH|nr:hypothetical protein [Chelatococcus sambhunathii]MDR4308486.1 hypothetical protein [Chelatococcus sambhunathii]